MIQQKKYKTLGLVLIILGILGMMYLVYDHQLQEHKDLKIIVAYHNKRALVENDTYKPMFVGRDKIKHAHKDGALSDEELSWLQQHMISDNEGDNISYLNRHFSEMTMIYWVWKNYDKIGDPKYIGFSHYRRILTFDKNLDKYDIQVLKGLPLNVSIKDIYTDKHGTKDIKILFDVFQKAYPNDYQNFIGYMDSNYSYLRNIFIMRKDIFFEYCEWIFPLLMEIHNKIDYNSIVNEKYPYYQTRSPGVIAELLTGYFIANKKNNKYKVTERHTNDLYTYLGLL